MRRIERIAAAFFDEDAFFLPQTFRGSLHRRREVRQHLPRGSCETVPLLQHRADIADGFFRRAEHFLNCTLIFMQQYLDCITYSTVSC